MSNEPQSYKGRVINPADPVKVYRNLTRKGVIYSVKQYQKVVAHTTHLTLFKCVCVVNHAAQQRIRLSGNREVHAYISGYVVDDAVVQHESFPMHYQPFQHDCFYIPVGPKKVNVWSGEYVIFGPAGVKIISPNN